MEQNFHNKVNWDYFLFLVASFFKVHGNNLIRYCQILALFKGTFKCFINIFKGMNSFSSCHICKVWSTTVIVLNGNTGQLEKSTRKFDITLKFILVLASFLNIFCYKIPFRHQFCSRPSNNQYKVLHDIPIQSSRKPFGNTKKSINLPFFC